MRSVTIALSDVGKRLAALYLFISHKPMATSNLPINDCNSIVSHTADFHVDAACVCVKWEELLSKLLVCPVFTLKQMKAQQTMEIP